MLHNRVQSIEKMASRIRELCPGARVEIGHGQMDEEQLEDVMSRFVAGETDVLVSTTIIESGLDIPNANTIIIDRADRFGLADLYQLRGRVGRAQIKAYAYLMLPAGDDDRGRRAQADQRHQAILARSAADSKSPCATWRFAARAISWAPRRAGTSSRSGSIFTASY